MNHLAECDFTNCRCCGRIEQQYALGFLRVLRSQRYREEVKAALWELIGPWVKDAINKAPAQKPALTEQWLWGLLEPRIAEFVETALGVEDVPQDANQP